MLGICKMSKPSCNPYFYFEIAIFQPDGNELRFIVQQENIKIRLLADILVISKKSILRPIDLLEIFTVFDHIWSTSEPPKTIKFGQVLLENRFQV